MVGCIPRPPPRPRIPFPNSPPPQRTLCEEQTPVLLGVPVLCGPPIRLVCMEENQPSHPRQLFDERNGHGKTTLVGKTCHGMSQGDQTLTQIIVTPPEGVRMLRTLPKLHHFLPEEDRSLRIQHAQARTRLYQSDRRCAEDNHPLGASKSTSMIMVMHPVITSLQNLGLPCDCQERQHERPSQLYHPVARVWRSTVVFDPRARETDRTVLAVESPLVPHPWGAT